MINTTIHVVFLAFMCASVAWNVFAMKRFAFINRRIESTHERIIAMGRRLQGPLQ